MQPVGARHLGLLAAGFVEPQIVKAERAGQTRLVVPVEEGRCLGDVLPVGEAGSPPPIVFRDRMELRQVESDQADVIRCGAGGAQTLGSPLDLIHAHRPRRAPG